MEIAGSQVEAELGLGVDPEKAQSRLKDLDQSIKALESELAKKSESLVPLAERARQNRKQRLKQSQGVPKPDETDPERVQPNEKPIPQIKAFEDEVKKRPKRTGPPITENPEPATAAQDDLAKLQGRWRLTRLEPGPEELVGDAASMDWVIDGKTMTLLERGTPKHRNELTLGVQDGEKTIDLVHVEDSGTRSTSLALYRLNGDTLEVCLGNPNRPRPKVFGPSPAGLSTRMMILERQATSTALVNARIKELETQLAEQRGETKTLQERLDQQNSSDKVGVSPKAESSQKPSSGKPTDRLKPETSVTRLPNSNNYVVVIPKEQDRVTVLHTVTGVRVTHRFPEALDRITPVPSAEMLALVLEGPAVRQLAIFNYLSGEWHTQDLKEATTKASPVVRNSKAVYSLGRFIYLFNTRAKKWSILELKQAPRLNDTLSGLSGSAEGDMIILEGDVLHIYDDKTGEWTHEDMDKPEVAAPKPSIPKDDVPRSAPGGSFRTKPQTPEPIVQTLSAGEPTLFAVISAERDRVTMIDSQTQKREILRLPKGVKEVTLLDRRRFVGLSLEGQAITRTAFYDRKAGKWFEHELKDSVSRVTSQIMFVPVNDWPALIGLDLIGPELTQLEVFNSVENKWIAQPLREPVKGSVGASMSQEAAIYRLGRDVYIYSAIAKKWAALQLKQGYREIESGGNGSAVLPRLADNGKLVVPEADVIHIYDVKTGDWTHIDTKDDK